MHIVDNGKEHIVFTQISKETVMYSLDKCKILFTQDVMLAENKKAQMIIVEKDNASRIISDRVGIEIRPADRAFIHTVDAKFVQGQEILVGFIQDKEVKNITLFPCMVTDIIPNGYLS